MKKKKKEIIMKKNPKNTDNKSLKYLITGSLSARNPQIKNSNYASLEIEITVFIIFYISYFVSFYPFRCFISKKNSFKKINIMKDAKRNNKISDVVDRLIKALSLT